MIEEPKNAFEEIVSDPNFLMILAGAVIWFVGFYIVLIGPLFLSTGFVLVSFSAAVTSLKRPVALAWPGLLLGGLLHIIGYYLPFIPVVGALISPLFIVPGSVLIIYFAIPLALQRGELPVITQLQKLIESKTKKEEIKDIETAEPVKEDEVVEDEELANND
ncbi:MAG: hypothetical protein RTV72_01810 [Candidatus Thorarchaeota archaeon]